MAKQSDDWPVIQLSFNTSELWFKGYRDQDSKMQQTEWLQIQNTTDNLR
jgi:hypothetical protein